MDKKNKENIDNILKEIKITEERIRNAKSINDKVGYELALKKQEELYIKYNHILYKKQEPTQVFQKKY